MKNYAIVNSVMNCIFVPPCWQGATYSNNIFKEWTQPVYWYPDESVANKSDRIGREAKTESLLFSVTYWSPSLPSHLALLLYHSYPCRGRGLLFTIIITGVITQSVSLIPHSYITKKNWENYKNKQVSASNKNKIFE